MHQSLNNIIKKIPPVELYSIWSTIKKGQERERVEKWDRERKRSQRENRLERENRGGGKTESF